MQHGGDLGEAMALFGGAREAWLDLSTGINPFAYPVRTQPAALWKSLPEQRAMEALLAAARKAYHVPDSLDIVAGPGTQALIQWLPRLVPVPAGTVGIISPTYVEHERAWRQAGHRVVPLRPGRPLESGLRHAVLVHPNNPDGKWVNPADARVLGEHVAAQQGWLVIDEAFVDTAPERSLTTALADLPVITLRSFGKFYGLAGIRLGFAIGPKAIIASLREALGPWPVSGMAIALATGALADQDWAEAMRQRLGEEADALDRVLLRYGFVTQGGTPLYRMTRSPAPGMHAALAGQRIWTRAFDWDPGLIRFGLPPGPAARETLAIALSKIRHG